MHPFSASKLLNVWERGRSRSPVQRALELLAAACPENSPDVLARTSVGQRDALLLKLREWTFGPWLIGLAICPACGERLELTFKVADVLMLPEADSDEIMKVEVSGYEVHFRLPSSLDLSAAAGAENLESAYNLLLERSLMAAYHEGRQVPISQLPSSVIDAVTDRMEQSDPQANVQVDLSCLSCGHRWQATFDIVTFFWSEIDSWAHRILRDVHTLAHAYGWSEADILAMSQWRRQFYLEMVSE